MRMPTRLASRALQCANRVQQNRPFFDFIAETSKPKTSEAQTQTSKKAEGAFSWDFLDYLKKHEPDKAAEYERDLSRAKAAENWLGGATPVPPKIDWAKHKSRIADPSFVDKLETEMKATEDYWKKWTKYSQTTEWKPAGWAEEQQRDFSFEKMDPNESEVRAAKIVQAQELMEKHRELLEEIKLDYEQLEAERDLFTASEETVQYALHPQLAEMQEETQAGKQTFHDFLLGGHIYARYVKTERLAQAQNENRRKMFLERYTQYSYLRGYDGM